MDVRKLMLEAAEALERYRDIIPVDIYRRDVRPVVDQLREYLLRELIAETKRKAAQQRRPKPPPPELEELDTVPQSLVDDTVPQKFPER